MDEDTCGYFLGSTHMGTHTNTHAHTHSCASTHIQNIHILPPHIYKHKKKKLEREKDFSDLEKQN